MPDATPVFGWHYPNDTDTLKAALKDIPKQVALDIEATLAGWAGVAAQNRVTLTNANLLNSFTTGTANATCYRKIGSTVDLSIQVNRASAWAANTTILQLPVGYRPSFERYFLGSDLGTTYVLAIATTGLVRCLTGGANGLFASTTFHL